MRDKLQNPQLLMRGSVSGNSVAVRWSKGPGGVMNQTLKKMVEKWGVLLLLLMIPAMAFSQKKGASAPARPAARPSGGAASHPSTQSHAAAARPSTQSHTQAARPSTQSHAPAAGSHTAAGGQHTAAGGQHTAAGGQHTAAGGQHTA